MAVTWTADQQDAIDARGGSVLVSAAAGSGKTAVLVQRAIARLTDPDNPVPADRLLIVTFTRAAAAEMRARLEKRLYEMTRRHPEDEALRRQTILLSQATIGTMHSYCSDILREFFHALGISQQFILITDKQVEELKRTALAEAMDQAYEQGAITRLADAFSGERDDNRLAQTVLRLFTFMQSHPFPEKWLNEKVSLFFAQNNVSDSPWGQVLMREALEAALFCIEQCAEALRLCCEDEKLKKAFFGLLSDELDALGELREAIENEGWDKARLVALGIRFARMTAPRGYKDDPLKVRIAALRDEYKKVVLQTLQPMFQPIEAQILDEFLETGKLTAELANLTMAFSARYAERKLEKDYLDYNDLEHFMLKLLLDEEGNLTAQAQTLASRYDEIMIDEYQDINEVQNLVFSSISRQRENLFMVGDVKQSIYGFRQAMPEIFLRHREAAMPYDRKCPVFPARISLDRNFRSRETVTESVNFIFSNLMRQETADIEYAAGEALVCGANYPPNELSHSELCFVERKQGDAVEEIEAAWIAEKFKRLQADGFLVYDGGRQRPIAYRDVCVLLRSANTRAHAYAAELARRGIPAHASVPGGFFDTREIGLALSFLRIIDNPNQDIPLLTVLLSPIYGFTLDEIGYLRADNKEVSLYLSISMATDNEKYVNFLEDLTQLRATAAAMPSDVFINYLYQKTGYPELALSMENGEQRLANLRLLQRHARDYESSGYHGLHGFVRFMDRLMEQTTDMPVAQIEDSGTNRVQVMSIHKSKGLEFPVCFVAGCSRGKNAQYDDVLLHPDLGLGIRLVDRNRNVRFTTMAREAIMLDMQRREAAEEMRVLYVALTRAKEKLIIVSAEKRLSSSLQKQAAKISAPPLSAYVIRHAASFSQWMMLCALQHPDGEALRKSAGYPSEAEYAYDEHGKRFWQIEIVRAPDPILQETETKIRDEPVAEDQAFRQRLEKMAAFIYPYAGDIILPTKVTASAIATMEQTNNRNYPLNHPAWLSENKLSPAQKGTALHHFMQFADFQLAAKSVELELERLVKNGFMAAEEAVAVDLQKVEAFLRGSLGKRILHADEVRKEMRFTVEIKANECFSDLPDIAENQKVILQGAVDCVFKEKDKVYVVDFKTDRGKPLTELLQNYTRQLRLYQNAVEQIFEQNVEACYLYSTYHEKAIAYQARLS